jgi:hypothetical protein
MPGAIAVYGCNSVMGGQESGMTEYRMYEVSREDMGVRSDPREHMDVRRDTDLQ